MHAYKMLITILFGTVMLHLNAQPRKYISFEDQGLRQYKKALDESEILIKALKLTPQEKIEALLYLDTLVRCKNSDCYQRKAEKANKLLTFVSQHASELQKLTSPVRGVVIAKDQLSLPQRFVLEAIAAVQQIKNNAPQTTAISATSTSLKTAYNTAIDRLHTIILYQTQQLSDQEFNDFVNHLKKLNDSAPVVHQGLSAKATQLFRQLETLYRNITHKFVPEPLQKSAQELADKFVQHAAQALTEYRNAHLPY